MISSLVPFTTHARTRGPEGVLPHLLWLLAQELASQEGEARNGPASQRGRRHRKLADRRALSSSSMPRLPSGRREGTTLPLPGRGWCPVALGWGKGLGSQLQSISWSQAKRARSPAWETRDAPQGLCHVRGALQTHTHRHTAPPPTAAWHATQAQCSHLPAGLPSQRGSGEIPHCRLRHSRARGRVGGRTGSCCCSHMGGAAGPVGAVQLVVVVAAAGCFPAGGVGLGHWRFRLSSPDPLPPPIWVAMSSPVSFAKPLS